MSLKKYGVKIDGVTVAGKGIISDSGVPSCVTYYDSGVRPSFSMAVRVEDKVFGANHVLPGTFVYRDKDMIIRRASIERVIYSNPATVVVWDDGTKTVCKCFAGDTYNPETGLTVCILKKLCGASAVKDTINAWLPVDDYKPGKKIVQTLKNVRAIVKK